MGQKLKAKTVPGACLFHDRVNLICLPILAAMSVLGLLGLYSPEKVTPYFFEVARNTVVCNFLRVVKRYKNILPWRSAPVVVPAAVRDHRLY